MSTETRLEARSVRFKSSQQVRGRRIAVVLGLLVSVTVLGGIGTRQQYASKVLVSRIDDTQSPRYLPKMLPVGSSGSSFAGAALPLGPTSTGTPPPESLSPFQAPGVIQPSSADAPNAIDGQVTINFDEFSSPTVITNQYPPAVFSTQSPWYVEAHNRAYYGSSFPNYLDRGPYVQPHGYAPLYVDFTSPVNNLSFWVVGADNNTVIAQVSIYQNRTYATTLNMVGRGNAFTPVLIDLGSAGYNSITRIEIININDPNGIGFDDFSFTTTTPSPTPTPTPAPNSPPLAPTLLSAIAGDEEVSLQWTSSQTAATYKVKQLTESGFPVNGGTSTVSAPTANYTARNLTPNVVAYFVVSAVNAFGESSNSNRLSVTPMHNCGTETFKPRPTLKPWDGAGWHLESEVSDRDGLVIRNVTLNGRPMAVMMSLPYFEVKTDRLDTPRRGELTPDNANVSAPLRTRLIGYAAGKIEPQSGHVVAINIKAQYAVDNISPGSKSCLFVNQEYEFDERSAPGQGCEPSGVLPCSRFYPKTSYTFVGRDNEALQWIKLPQRLHFKVIDNNGVGSNGNSVGVFRDCEVLTRDPLGNFTTDCTFRGRPSPFSNKDNPIHWEQGAQILLEGRPLPDWYNSFDSFHQSASPVGIEEPVFNVSFAGCPDCVHIHWRWGTAAAKIGEFLGRGNFGQGRPIGVIPGSRQATEIAFVKYRATEVHPDSWESVQRDVESIRDFHDPKDVVFWYIGTGYSQNHDEFFNHGAFFNPNLGSNVQRGPGQNSSFSQSQSTSADGPTSVTFGYLYQEGLITFAQIDAAMVGPLPAGYALLNNFGHNITTDSVFSGANIVSFSVPSVTDQTTFGNLRILHAEQDPFDPEGIVWVDRTILSPDPLAPNFSAHTINARVPYLGKFVIATLSQPPNTNTVDLSVSLTHSPEPVVADNNLTYSIIVSNGGPQQSTRVGLIDGLSQDVGFVSATASQGSCMFKDGSVYCKLGTLANGSSATVTITVKPTEGITKFPVEGQTIKNIAMVKGNESDPNEANNSVTDTAIALPSSNARPSVSIMNPTVGALFVAPANITIIAQTTDSDGSVALVDFYDGQDLIGSGSQTSTAGQYRFDWNNVGVGPHELRALVTDNGGKTGLSNPVTLLVNGPATINITSPASGSVFAPGSNLVINATASHPFGSITNVSFITDGIVIGNGTLNGSQYSVTWANVPRGKYVLSAIATDNSTVQTISSPINITVTDRPTVNISQPTEGTSFPAGPNILINARVAGSVVKNVEFYADGSLLGSGVAAGDDSFRITWQNAPDGVHSLTVTAIDDLDVRTSSSPVNISVNSASGSGPGQFVWFDDSLPAGATLFGDGDSWYWVDANPGALSGTKSHQSRDFRISNYAAPSFHQHGLTGATATLPVNSGDKLFTYVFLDNNSLPLEIMLQWNDGNNWEHRAYWGEDRISYGTEGTNSRRYIGALPRAGQWVRLEVPADLVGLQNTNVSGMAFSLSGGRATWDLAGKTTANATPPTSTDFVWVEDAVPAGGIQEVIDDQWVWLPPHFSGTQGHRSFLADHPRDVGKFRAHSFRNASTTMNVQPGDVLFTYVYLDGSDNGAKMPEEIVLQWNDGSSWEHRAYWGLNYLSSGTLGTETNRFMGSVPPGERWVRLEVPASYVGLEGKTVSGMSFGFYDTSDYAGINWDYSGKSSRANTIPLPLSATTAVWQYGNGGNSGGVVYNTSDFGGSPIKRFYTYPNQAAGTVPMYRFRKADTSDPQRFYSRSPSITNWLLDDGPADKGIPFYVYPDGSTPGTVPVYLYHDSHFNYFLTTDQNEANSHPPVDSSNWAYVFASNPAVPAAPSSLWYYGGFLGWNDNSSNEAGFKIEYWHRDTRVWTQLGMVGSDVISWKVVGGHAGNYYRVRAFNLYGNSGYSNVACTDCIHLDGDPPPNTPPEVSISSPRNGDIAGLDVAIAANAFDDDGAGTIAKVEFFADNNKLGELSSPPYLFAWTNAAPGNHVLTAKVTDSLGATATSAPVSITVTNPASSAQIVFASNRDGSSQVYSMNSDGSSQIRLTNTLANDEAPRRSPNNARIAFQSDRANPFCGVADIYVMNIDGSGQTQLTTDAADDSAPVWSPDGTKIAFQSARNGVSYQVYVMNVDGSGQVNVSNNAAMDGQPSWSPDGTKIAFTSDRDHPGKTSIYVMNANGSNQTRLTFSASDVIDDQPVWSPNGTMIAFVSTRDSLVETWQETDDDGGILTRTRVNTNKEVYLMNADGTNQFRLTNILGNDDSPMWSRDGTKLLFRSDRERECCDPVAQIWVMYADGTNQLNLSNNSFGDYSGSW